MEEHPGADRTRILIAGGGFLGLHAALSLLRRLRHGEAEITLVNPENFMVYQSFLPEAAGGNIEPRHVVVPLRDVLGRRVRLITGHLTALDHARRTARVEPTGAEPYDLAYDHVVVGLGSVSRLLPVPGLAERGVGFKTVSEAIYLRNQVLSRLDAAESTTDPDLRRRALTFVFVGGGYAGIEALGELEDLARDACRLYRTVRRDDMRWVLVEASDGVLPEVGGGLGAWALDLLRERGVEIHLSTRLESAEGGVMALSNGDSFPADTLVWTTGVRADPLAADLGFPVDERGSIVVDETLRVKGVDRAWAAGDCAAVPDLTTGGTCPPTSQHALRQARHLGANLAAVVRGGEPTVFRHENLGYVVSLGRYKGVANIAGIRLHGFPAWWVHRSYHLLMIPTLNRKVRIVLDWTVALFFPRDVAQLGSLRRPREPFEQAAGD